MPWGLYESKETKEAQKTKEAKRAEETKWVQETHLQVLFGLVSICLVNKIGSMSRIHTGSWS